MPVIGKNMISWFYAYVEHIEIKVSIYKSIFLVHVLKEQLGDILFISFVIASGEAIIFYFE
jgi:hypothetical protein